MGDRGPAGESDEMKARKGNPGKRKPKGQNSPFQALSKRPRVPRYLCADKIAAAEWRRISKVLVAAGKLTNANLRILETYCLAYSRLRTAEKDISTKGQVSESPKGYPMQNPSIGIANTAQKEMRECLKVIEKTKAAPAEKKKSALEQFMDKKKGLQGDKGKVVARIGSS